MTRAAAQRTRPVPHRDSDPAAEESGDAVPCAVLAEGKKAKVGDDISQMGLIDFGVVGVPAERAAVAVYNPNPMPLTIKSVESSVRSVSVTRVEVSAAASRHPSPTWCRGRSCPPRTRLLTSPPAAAVHDGGGQERRVQQEFWSVRTGRRRGDHTLAAPATVHVLAAPEREETAPKGALTFYLDNGRQLSRRRNQGSEGDHRRLGDGHARSGVTSHVPAAHPCAACSGTTSGTSSR